MAGLIGIIHVAKSQLGMDDDTYRALLLDLTGKDSCSKLTRGEQWQVIEELKRKGFQKKQTHKGKHLINGPQAKKIRALSLQWPIAALCATALKRRLPGACADSPGAHLKTPQSSSASP